MPFSLQVFTKSKYFWLSKNIWVVIYSAPASTLAFRYCHVCFQVRRFEMFFGITGDPNTEIGFAAVLNIFFQVNALVQVYHLFQQIQGIVVSAGFRCKGSFIFRCIAA